MWTRISRVNSTSEAISNMSEHGEHQRDETSVADLGKRGDKRADQQRRGGERAEHGEVNGAAQQNHPARERGGHRRRWIDGAGVDRPQGSLLVANARSNRVIKIDRNAATAPSINAGAVACEMAVLS